MNLCIQFSLNFLSHLASPNEINQIEFLQQELKAANWCQIPILRVYLATTVVVKLLDSQLSTQQIEKHDIEGENPIINFMLSFLIYLLNLVQIFLESASLIVLCIITLFKNV